LRKAYHLIHVINYGHPLLPLIFWLSP